MTTTKTKLFRRDFTLVVIGQIISLFGNAIIRFALPLYLLRETGSSTLYGAVTACSFIPMILMSLFGGILADRANKRNIMVILDFCTAALIGIFYFSMGEIPIIPLMIVFLMILYGISGTYQPAVQASIPALSKSETLMQANAVINMVSTLSGLLGPVIGGILFGTFGIVPILIVGLLCFTISAVMELFIHIPFQKQAQSRGIVSTVKSDLQESWHFVRRERPAFLSVVLTLALFNLVLSAAMIVGIPVMVVNILGMSDTSLGFTQGALGLGGLAGGVLAGAAASKIKIRHSSYILLFCSAASAGMGAALLPIFPPSVGYIIIMVTGFAAMAASTLFSIQMCTIVQQQTPPHLVGKIMAVIIAVASSSQPLGQALYGILFDVFAAVPSAVMFGAAAAAVLISFYSKAAFVKLEDETLMIGEDSKRRGEKAAPRLE